MSPDFRKSFVIGTVALAAAGCVYESFEEPVPFFADPNNNPIDMGNNTTPNNTTPNNTTPNNVTTPDMDMGNDGGDADMGTEPWRCPRVELDDAASTTGMVKVGALGGGNYLATWPVSNDSQRVAVFDSAGDISWQTDFTSLVSHPQRVELLTDDTSTFYLVLGFSSGVEFVECETTPCPLAQDPGKEASEVAAFWLGGEYPPYIIFNTDADNSVTQFATVSGFPTAMKSEHPDVNAVTWIATAALTRPDQPNLTAYSTIATVDSNKAIRWAQRMNSNDAIVQTATECTPSAANVGKVQAVPLQSEQLIADIQSGNDVVVSRFSCNGSSSNITEPIIGLRDWVSIPLNSNTRTFYIDSAGLSTSRHDGSISTVAMDGEDYELLGAARSNSTNEFAVVTVDANGVVHMRAMSDSGECL